MVAKKRSGSERVKTGSSAYLASERAKRSGQGAFASHPKGMALPALDRRRNARTGACWPVLHASPSPSSGRSHVTALEAHDTDPSVRNTIPAGALAGGTVIS